MSNSKLFDFEILEKLGSGTFGQVNKVYCKTTNEFKALKKIPIVLLNRNEIEALATLKHPNIITYQDSFEDNLYFYLITEYCEGGSLWKHLQNLKENNQFLKEHDIFRWIKEILLAVEYLHSKNIIHRDLKTDNVYLKKGTIKIGDFGLVRNLENSKEFANTADIGTLQYMSPEVINGAVYNTKSDIWSIGCILYEMCTNEYAFDDNTQFNTMKKIIEKPVPKLSKKIFSEAMRSLLKICLAKNPNERPTANELLDFTIYKLPKGPKHQLNNTGSIKCVFVGDCNKTSIITAFLKQKLSEPMYIPTIFDNYSITITFNSQTYELNLFDTSGQEEYDRLRPLTYRDTNVFLICFSVVKLKTLINIKEKWIPEIRHFCPETPYLLIGTEINLRDDENIKNKLKKSELKPITRDESIECAKEINAIKYVECSEYTFDGINDVFEEAVKTTIASQDGFFRLKYY